MNLTKVYLHHARRLPHLHSRALRHAWVRAKLRTAGGPRVPISTRPVKGFAMSLRL